jgi:hypothetical protein
VKTLPQTMTLYTSEKWWVFLCMEAQLEHACRSLTAVLENRYELTSPNGNDEDAVVECSGFTCLKAPSAVHRSCDKAAAEVILYVFGYKLHKMIPTFKKTATNTRYLYGT